MNCLPSCNAHFGHQCTLGATRCARNTHAGVSPGRTYEITREYIQVINRNAKEAIIQFQKKGIPLENIVAAIPAVFAQACAYACLEPYVNPVVNLFYGVQTVPGYENAIVIFFRHGLESDVEPIKIPINFIKS